MSVFLRAAVPADMPVIVKLMNIAYRGSGPDASWNTAVPYIDGDRTSESALQEELAASPNAALLPECRGSVIRNLNSGRRPGAWR